MLWLLRRVILNCHLTVIRLAGRISLSDAYPLNSPSTLAQKIATSPLVKPSILLAFANLKPRSSRHIVPQIDLISRPKCYLSFFISFVFILYGLGDIKLSVLSEDVISLKPHSLKRYQGDAEGRKYFISNRNRFKIYLR